MRIIQYAVIVCCFMLTSCQSNKENSIQKFKWQTYRGVNMGCNITENDVRDLSKTGANLIRLSMPVCAFMEIEEPFSYNEEAFVLLDSVLNWGERYNINVLIDPHRYPGTNHKWTMLGDDPFFQDFKYHDILIRFWERLAKQCAKRGEVVAGYDLLNEPQVDLDTKKVTAADIKWL